MEGKTYIATYHYYLANSTNPYGCYHMIYAASYLQARKMAFEFAKKTWHGPVYLMNIKEL